MQEQPYEALDAAYSLKASTIVQQEPNAVFDTSSLMFQQKELYRIANFEMMEKICFFSMNG